MLLPLFVESAGTAVGLTGLCMLVGFAFPRSWLLSGESEGVQRILLGFASLVLLLHFPYREQLPIIIGLIFSVALAIFGAVMVIRRFGAASEGARQHIHLDICFREWVIWALATLPLLALFYGPLVIRGAFFLPTIGPDWFGTLMSASYIAAGHGWGDLMHAMHQVFGNYKWWEIGTQRYRLPDLRQGVALDQLISELRWGHAVIATFISRVTGEPVWTALYSLMVFSVGLLPAVIVDAARSRGINPMRAILVAVIVTAAQTYVLMLNEGLDTQFIAMPMSVYLLFNFHRLMTKQTSIGQKFSMAVLLNALIITYAVAIQIIIIYVVFLALVVAIHQHFRRSALAQMIGAVSVIGGLCVVIGPVNVSDFIVWSLRRMHEDFNGGLLHEQWSVLSLVFSLPYVTLLPKVGPYFILSNDWAGRAMEVVVLICLGIAVVRRRGDEGLQFLAVSAAIALFVFLNVPYPIWKSECFYQPLLVVCGVAALPEHLKIFRTGAVLAVYAAFVLIGGGRLLAQYVYNGWPVRPDQFTISESSSKEQRLVLVTPSLSMLYLARGASNPFYLLQGWRPFGVVPDFRIGNIDNLHIGIYYDCDAEGQQRCSEIRRATGLPPRVIRALSVRVSTLEDRPGHISNAKVKIFIKSTFGVPAEGGSDIPRD